nr:MAG TPA: hypothetical protein [Caudoviricetes sp.]
MRTVFFSCPVEVKNHGKGRHKQRRQTGSCRR